VVPSNAARTAERLVERQGSGDALELDRSQGMEPQGVVVVGPVGSVLADHDLSRPGVGSNPGGQVDGPSVDVPVLGDDRTGVDADMVGWQAGRRGTLDDIQPREHGSFERPPGPWLGCCGVSAASVDPTG
jgi:hypothetical protein